MKFPCMEMLVNLALPDNLMLLRIYMRNNIKFAVLAIVHQHRLQWN
jgi:hypothetical protein